jgi:hypothetical protein
MTISEHKKIQRERGCVIFAQYKTFWRGIKRIKKIKQKKNDFINQVTMDIFTRRRVNVMIFKNGKIKIAGCESTNDAIFIMITIYNLLTPDVYKIEGIPSFLFTSEMINVSFSFPFCINKVAVNNIFNRLNPQEYFAFYEQTGQQYVNLKIFNKEISRLCIQMKQNEENYELNIVERPFKKKPIISFMIFDQRVIMSGVDIKIMKRVYQKFLDLLNDNIDEMKKG